MFGLSLLPVCALNMVTEELRKNSAMKHPSITKLEVIFI